LVQDFEHYYRMKKVYRTLLRGRKGGRIMSAITGVDSTSLLVLEALKNGMKIKDIPQQFSISLDQAKRLSRYSNYLQQAQMHLSQSDVQKLRFLGLRSLHLGELFRKQDWEGLGELLSQVTEQTTRAELPFLIHMLKEKRERIQTYQLEVNRNIELLERQEQELLQAESDFLRVRLTH
jgi:hypothetical protein